MAGSPPIDTCVGDTALNTLASNHARDMQPPFNGNGNGCDAQCLGEGLGEDRARTETNNLGEVD